MAENTNQQQQSQRQPCPGDCAGCNIYQRNFCSAILGHTNMKILTALVKEVNGLGNEINALKAKIEAAQRNAEELIDPTSEE